MLAVRSRTVPSLALLLCSGPLLAQQAARPPTAGVEAPVRSLLLDDDATALTGNPGALAFAGGLQLEYLHENGTGGRALQGNGLYLAGGLPWLVLGTALEWLRTTDSCTPATPCDRRFSLGAGLRLGQLGLGATYHSHSSNESTDLDHLTTWDLGAVAYPLRFLALGFAALDVGAPRSGQLSLPRRYAASAGLRPLGEQLSLTADAYFRECAGGPAPLVAGGPCGSAHPDLRFTSELALIRGLTVVAQLGHGGQDVRWSGQIGLQLDAAHFGVRGAQEIASVGGRTAFKARLSQETLPAFDPFGGRAVEIDLDRALKRPKPGLLELALGGGTSPDPLALTLATLRRLAKDSRVAAVALRTSGLPFGRASAEELRSGIEELRAAGKKVIFYLESGGNLEYYVASSADRVFAAPQAVLAVNGFSATAIFVAGGLGKLGVKAEFFRVGAYKNAPDIFTRTEISAEQREVQEALLDDVYGRFTRAVVLRRGVSEAKLKDLLDKGLLKPGEAVNGKLLDGLVYPDQLGEEVGKLLGVQKVRLEQIGVQPPPAKEVRWGVRDRIGVVRVEGDIAPGDAGDPLGLIKIASAHSIARRIRRLADDPRTRALVVRIDSAGGDGNASDLIWRELVRARREMNKKVVASLGDVAASGGYYVAVGADEIVAEPSTLTGSIGVFIGHFDASELYHSLGLSFATTRRGASADLFSTTRGLTDRERAMLQDWVATFYAGFVQRVAEGRGMTERAVDAVAQGRVWSGAQAKERGLVDRIGGFEDALLRARDLAGIGRDEQVFVDDQERPGFDLLEAAVSGAATRILEDSPLARALPRGEALRALRALAALGEPDTVRARMPYEFELR
jgi:protease-4